MQLKSFKLSRQSVTRRQPLQNKKLEIRKPTVLQNGRKKRPVFPSNARKKLRSRSRKPRRNGIKNLGF